MQIVKDARENLGDPSAIPGTKPIGAQVADLEKAGVEAPDYAKVKHEIHIPPQYAGYEELYKAAYTMVKNNKHLSRLPSSARALWIEGFMNGVMYEQKRAPELMKALEETWKDVEEQRIKFAQEIAEFEAKMTNKIKGGTNEDQTNEGHSSVQVSQFKVGDGPGV